MTRKTVLARAITAAGRQAIGRIDILTITPIEEVRFERVRTIKASGRVVDADPAAQVKVEQSRTDELAKLGLVSVVSVAPLELEPGDKLEWTFSKTTRPVKPGEFWLTHEQAWYYPVELETVILDVPVERQLALHVDPEKTPVVETSHGRKIFRWSVPARQPKESEQPLFSLSSVTTWEALARVFVLMQTATPSSVVADKAKTITVGVEGARAQTLALYAWVSKSVRSVGAPFAVHGYRARPAEEVLRTGWGDCKDKHGLLSALLAARGIPAVAALVSTSGKIPFPDVPALSQFNHVLTVAKVDGHDLWLDSTIEVARAGKLLPVLRGSKALLVESATRELTTVPLDSSDSIWRIRGVGVLEPSGRLTLDTTIDTEGDAELLLRLLLRQTGSEGRMELARALAKGQAAGSSVAEVGGTEPLDIDRTFTLIYRATHPAFVVGARPNLAIPGLLPTLLEYRMTQSSHSNEGRNPTETNPALRLNESFELTLPGGATTELPVPVKVETAEGSYESRYERSQGGVTANRSLRLIEVPVQSEASKRQMKLLDLMLRDTKQVVPFSSAALAVATPSSGGTSAKELRASGVVLLDTGKPAEALTMLESALEKEPDNVATLISLSGAYRQLQRWSKCESVLRRALEIDQLNEQVGELLIGLLIERQRYGDAVEALDAQIRANPLDPKSWLSLASVQYTVGKPLKALEAMDAALRSDRQNPVFRLERAVLLNELGRAEEAIAESKEARRIAEASGLSEKMPSINVPFSMIAEAWMHITPGLVIRLPADTADGAAMTKVEAAVARLTALKGPETALEGLTAARDLAEALTLSARADRASGQLDRARSGLRVALNISLDTAIAADLADVCARLGKFEEALKAWALANRGAGVDPPAALAAHFVKTGLRGNVLSERLRTLGYDAVTARSVSTAQLGASKGCPSNGMQTKIRVRVIADASGAVTTATAFNGVEPCRDAAVATAKRLKLPQLVIEGKGIATARTMNFVFHPGGTIEAQWGYGINPEEELVALAKRIGE